MKKCIFTLLALMFFALGAQAFNYNTAGPSNDFGGRTNLYPPASSYQAYDDYRRSTNYARANKMQVDINYNDNSSATPSPRKQRKHGSAANKNRK